MSCPNAVVFDVWKSLASLVGEGARVVVTISVTEEVRWDGLLARGRTARCRHGNADVCKGGGVLCRGLWDLAAAHLLGFQVLVQQVQCLLVRSWAAGDGEHPLASVVVRSLGDGDASP